MAYGQWITIKIMPSNYDVILKNVHLEWGKFYDSDNVGTAGGNKDNEYQPSVIEEKVIKDGAEFSINSCGREHATSGTEGSIKFYDGTTQVGTYSWDCPWGGNRNTSTWTPSSDEYITAQTGANLESGAVGEVEIQTVKLS